jgi:hypothetical protein
VDKEEPERVVVLNVDERDERGSEREGEELPIAYGRPEPRALMRSDGRVRTRLGNACEHDEEIEEAGGAADEERHAQRRQERDQRAERRPEGEGEVLNDPLERERLDAQLVVLDLADRSVEAAGRHDLVPELDPRQLALLRAELALAWADEKQPQDGEENEDEEISGHVRPALPPPRAGRAPWP